MSWVSTNQVVDLILRGVLQVTDESEETRKNADRELRFERDNAMNFGDVLVDLIVKVTRNQESDDQDWAVAQSAILLLEGLVESGWSAATSFSDKPMVLGGMHNLMNDLRGFHFQEHATGGTIRKVMLVLAQCLVSVCVLEFPSSVWEDQITQQCGAYFGSEDSQDDESAGAFLHELTKNASKCPALWEYLTKVIVPDMPLAISNEPRQLWRALKLVNNLISSRPPTSTLEENAVDTNPLLSPQSPLTGMLLDVVHSVPDDLATNIGGFMASEGPTVPLPTQLRETLQIEEWAVNALCRFHPTASIHHPLLRRSVQCLARFADLFSNLHGSDVAIPDGSALSVTNHVEGLLEAVQCVLTRDGTAYSEVSSLEIFSLMVRYLEDVFEEDGVGSDETLLSDFMDDNVIPAGCGSGTPSNIAASVMQLFVEFDNSTLMVFGQVWLECTDNLNSAGDLDPQVKARRWHALSVALGAVARQCSTDGISLLDVTPNAEETFLVPIGVLLNNMENQPAELTSRLLTVLGSTLKLSNNVDVCRRALEYIHNVVDAHTPDRPVAITSTAVLALSRVLSASIAVCDAVASDVPWSAVEGAAFVAINGGPLGAFCGGTALRTFVEVCPQWTNDLWGAGYVPQVVGALLALCDAAAFSEILESWMHSLIDEDPSGSHGGGVADALCDIMDAARADTNRLCGRVVLETLHQLSVKPAGYAPDAALCAAADFGCALANDGPHEDSTLRLLAKSLGTFAATPTAMGEFNHAAMHDTMMVMLREAMEAHTNTATLSAVCQAAAVVFARIRLNDPSSLGDLMVGIVSFAASKGRDYNYLGACALLGVLILREGLPTLFQTIEMASGDSHRLQAIADFFGLWTALVPFCDRRTQRLAVCGWHQILEALFSGNASQHVNSFFTTPCTVNFRKVRSLHTRIAVEVPTYSASVALAIGVALATVAFERQLSLNVSKLVNFTNHDAFDVLLGVHVLCPSLAEQINSVGVNAVAAELLSLVTPMCPPSDIAGALTVLDYPNAGGIERWIGEALAEMERVSS